MVRALPVETLAQEELYSQAASSKYIREVSM